MKKLCIYFLLCFISTNAIAQKYAPVIKAGTILNYNVIARNSGQTAGINLTITSLGDPVQIKWEIPFVGKGVFEMSAKAMQSATKTIAQEPEPDETTRLPDDETLLVLSKDAYKDLIATKTFKLNGYTFNAQTDTTNYKINDKPADVLYAVSAKGNRQIWVLNNPDFPLICKASKVTPLIDFWLTALQEN